MKIDEWKKLIIEDKLNELFADFETYFYSTELGDIVILIASNYRSLIKEHIKGVISNEDYNVGLNKIKERILNFFSNHKEEIINITPNKKNRYHREEDVIDTVPNKKNESDILEIVKSIQQAGSKANNSEIIKQLTELQKVFYGVGKVISSINLSEYGEKERQQLIALFDKSVRRVKQGRTLVAISYDRHVIFYKSYLGEMKKLISLLDIPKSSYSEAEINTLKELETALNIALKFIDKRKLNQNNYREKTAQAISYVRSAFQKMNETILLNKLKTLECDAEKLFDDIEMYNPMKLYKKDDLLPLYNEIKISIVEIENK